MAEYAQQIAQVGLGHLVLALCAVFYLLWWCVFFRPGAKDASGVLRGAGIACIVLAAVCGIAAVALIVSALFALPASIPGFIVIAGGVVLYVVLLGITSIILDRKVTTELLLIVAWLVLELSFLNGIASTGLVTGASLIIMGLFVLVAFVACLVCYVLYYGLSGRSSFIDGMVPLVIVAFVALIFALLLH